MELDKLVILDVNGLLCQKVSLSNKTVNRDFLILNSYKVVARPNVNVFLRELQKEYAVAIFSSTTENNLNVLLQWLLDSDVYDELLFVWGRSHTKKYRRKNELKTSKLLSQVWSNNEVNSNGQWNSSNTLIVDHDPEKLKMNNSENVLIWREWYTGVSEEKNNYDLIILRNQIDRKLKLLPVEGQIES